MATQGLSGIGEAVASRGLPLGMRATLDSLHAFALEHLKRERLQYRESTAIIQDRCLLDLLAYARILHATEHLYLELLAELTVASMRHVAACFLTMIPAGHKDASTPNETSTFRLRVQAEIGAAAKELGLPLIEIDGSPDERLWVAVRRVKQALQEKGTSPTKA
jgi:hypothetical protein